MTYSFTSWLDKLSNRLPYILIVWFSLITLVTIAPVTAYGNADNTLPSKVESGLTALLAGLSPQAGTDMADAAQFGPVLDFVRQTPEMADYSPLKRAGTHGSFIRFAVNKPLKTLIRYLYNPKIPQGTINPSSVNYSVWKQFAGDRKELPHVWTLLDSAGPSPVIRGVVRESITPDLHTGAYYQHDLQRAIVFHSDATTPNPRSSVSCAGDSSRS